MKKLISLILAISVLLTMCIPAAAASESPMTLQEATAITAAGVECELQAKGTSITKELTDMNKYYLEMASLADTSEEEQKCMDLADTIAELLDEYASYTANLAANVQTTGSNDAYYAVAVAAIVTWFNGNDCLLASELLTRAKDNTVLDSKYTPIHKTKIINNPIVRDFMDSNSPKGSGEFEASKSLDLYYAIHLFNWEKDDNVFIFSDRYDYELGDQSYPDSIAEAAVYTMARAQRDGYITPYYVYVRVNM